MGNKHELVKLYIQNKGKVKTIKKAQNKKKCNNISKSERSELNTKCIISIVFYDISVNIICTKTQHA